MSGNRYMISDAAKKVDVETHVLRYWEEELGIGISRTELGHRYYTEEDIRVLQKIKELKERGLQLKAIRILIPELRKRSGQPSEKEDVPVENIISLEEKLNQRLKGELEEKMETLPAVGPDPDRIKQFESILTGILTQVIQENNAELESRITDSLSKEMELLLKVREEREEERFRSLDEAIRLHQRNRQFVAATKEDSRKKKKFGIF